MPKKSRQSVLFWDEDATMKARKMDIDVGRIVDDKNMRAWHHLDRLLIDFPQLGHTMALISPRTEIPICPFIKLSNKEQEKVRDVRSIAEENLERQGETAEQEAKRNRNAEMLKIAMICVGVVFILVCLLAMFPKSFSGVFGG